MIHTWSSRLNLWKRQLPQLRAAGSLTFSRSVRPLSAGIGVNLYFATLSAAVKYIPGLAFKKQAEAWKARIPDWVDRAFDGFKANMVSFSSG